MKNILAIVSVAMTLAACGTSEKEYDATGTFEATETTVSAEQGGRLLTFDVKEGDPVETGREVGLIDTTDTWLKILQLQATKAVYQSQKPDIKKQIAALRQQLAKAQAEQRRYQELVSDGAAPSKMLDDAKSQVQVLQRQLDAQVSALSTNTQALNRQMNATEAQISQLREQLKKCRESEDKVEFKRGEHGNVAYDGGTKTKPSDRRRCILGYVVALCNERGGTIVIGMEDRYPHKVVGTRQNENALGDLVSSIYRDTGIRPDVYELFEDVPHKTGRVVVIEVPPRPSGKVYKFEDVPLMRVGEELRPMSDECLYGILQEQEPDFSQQICESATIEDLDDSALDILREKYARKQNNPGFLTLPKNQVLSDLNLVVDGKVTNGAVILVGKESFIRRTFPQAAVMLEYRSTEAQIPFDNRQEYHEPFFVMIERLWRDINLRNGSIPVREGPYVFDIPVFNEDVIRDAWCDNG